jgi:hypothetical protein
MRPVARCSRMTSSVPAVKMIVSRSLVTASLSYPARSVPGARRVGGTTVRQADYGRVVTRDAAHKNAGIGHCVNVPSNVMQVKARLLGSAVTVRGQLRLPEGGGRT